MNATVDLTAVPLWGLAVFQMATFALMLAVTAGCWRLITGFKRPEPAPVPPVVPPWRERDLTDEPAALPGPAIWRSHIDAEVAPMCPPLPAYPSLAKFRPFNLADPQHTGAWPVIGGLDELDLEATSKPVQMPGFEVDVAAHKRFVRSPAEVEALAVARGYAPRPRQFEVAS